MPIGRFFVGALALSLFSGCGSAHLEAGRRALSNGNLPAAVEIFDQGVAVEPGNQELRQLAIQTRQVYGHELRQEIDRLVRNQRRLLALGRLLVLEELSRRAEEVSMPGDLPAEVERERHQVTQEAIQQLDRSMDRRSGRGISVKADLETCRQLQALTENDEKVRRTCDRLRSRFKLVAVLEQAEDAWPGAAGLLPGVDRVLKQKNPELIELVDRASGRHTARMVLWVGEPEFSDQPWLLKNRKAFQRWIPKKDRKGRQITETVVVRPTAKQIANAKKNNRPPPKSRKVRKKVWEQISGEFRVYHARRTVTLPYRVVIHDLRKHTLAVAFQGRLRSLSRSSYYEYTGDPRGEQPAPVPHRGRRNAPALLSRRALVDQALAELPGRVVTTTLERVE